MKCSWLLLVYSVVLHAATDSKECVSNAECISCFFHGRRRPGIFYNGSPLRFFKRTRDAYLLKPVLFFLPLPSNLRIFNWFAACDDKSLDLNWIEPLNCYSRDGASIFYESLRLNFSERQYFLPSTAREVYINTNCNLCTVNYIDRTNTSRITIHVSSISKYINLFIRRVFFLILKFYFQRIKCKSELFVNDF